MNKKYKLPLYLISILIFSRMFFYPLNIQTRFSAGIIVLNFILLVERSGYYKKLIPWCALLISAERITYYALFEGLPSGDIISKVFPIFLYYCTYMTVLSAGRYHKSSTLEKGGILLLADVLSNGVELFTRGEVSILGIEYTLMVSLIRIAGAAIIYLIYRYRVMIITQEIHQEKYLSLNLLVSSLEAELFYLKKSKKDIEEVMKKAHSLYLSDEAPAALKETSLDIAREVHEIKKDYFRISKGIEQHLKNFTHNNYLSLSKLGEIITSGSMSYIKKVQKDISFSLDLGEDMVLTHYHILFILINNLIVNAVDAIGDSGEVRVTAERIGENLVIQVADTGKGILEKNIPLLFNPGFTTKYDKETGEMNTGLGLSHVRNIISEIRGEVEIDSTPGEGTTFRLLIPLTSIVKGEQ